MALASELANSLPMDSLSLMAFRNLRSYCIRLRGNNAEHTYTHTTPAKLVGMILQAGKRHYNSGRDLTS